MLLLIFAVVMTGLAFFAGTSVLRTALDIFGSGAGIAVQLLVNRYLTKSHNREAWNLLYGSLLGLISVELMTGNRAVIFPADWKAVIPYVSAAGFMAGAFFVGIILHYFDGDSALYTRHDKISSVLFALSAISSCILGFEVGTIIKAV